MQHRETRDRLPCKIVLVRIIEALAILVLLPTVTVGQQPLLQITSPTNGAVVVPGQNVVVSVSSPAGAAFAQADVIGQNPIGSSSIATAIPAQFTVAIPADIGLGQYLLTAEGTTSAGQDAESTAIAIDVERSDIPTLLSPSFASLTFSRVGQSSPVDIVALFSDGSILDVSNSSYISFTSTNPNVAVVDGHGLVTALASGSGYIIAAYAVGGGTRIASLPIKVPSSVTGGVNNFSIAATPFRQTVLSGSSVTYTISVSPMAGFSGTVALGLSGLPPGTSGVFSPAQVVGGTGASTLTVSTSSSTPPGTYAVTVIGSSGSFYPSASLQLVVVPQGSPTFTLSASPPTKTISAGTSFGYSLNLNALNGFSGSVSLAVTGLPSGVTSTFSPSAISGGSGSSTLTVSTSTSTPTGAYTLALTGNSSTVSNSAITTLTVSPTLTAITVTPTGSSIAAGTTQQFTATGTYSDGTTKNLTSTATWSSATTTVATISTSGLATAVGVGTSTIKAASGATSGSTNLTVSSGASLQSVAVTPVSPTIPKGKTQQFTATGTYSDGTTKNLTSTATWSSATATVATISASGLATGIGMGTSTIKATSGAVSGSTTLIVSAATLQSIAVTPGSPSIGTGGTQQFVATGTYSDGTTQNLSNGSTWASSTTTIAVINISGFATAGVSAGTTTVTASASGMTSPGVILTVSSTPPTITSITPPSGPVGTSVTVSGRNFGGGGFDGSSQGGTLTVNGISVSPTRWSPASILGSIPVLATTGNVVVTLGGRVSNAVNFNVTAPYVLLSPSSLTFPTQTVGTVSAPMTFKITNSSAVMLTFGEIVALPNFSQTNNCGTSIAAGASCTVSVTFSPSATGSLTGTIFISDVDNGISGQQLEVLSGTGK